MADAMSKRSEGSKIAINLAMALVLFLISGLGVVLADTKTVTLRVTGMSCEGCARTLETALKKEEGVFDARVSYERGEAWIKYDDQKITLDKLREIIKSAGFGVVPETGETNETEPTDIASPAARKYSENLEELRASFNRDMGKVRLLMLLSPT